MPFGVNARLVVLGGALGAIAASLFVREYFLAPIHLQKYEQETIGQEDCTPDHVTATHYKDLLFPNGGNVTTAADSVRHHGVSFFEDLLLPEKAATLRDYILHENRNSDRFQEFVLENENRSHLVFDLDREDDIVYDSVRAVLTQQTLRGVMEELLGPDAALMELAAITAYPGAAFQDWHKDTFLSDRSVDMYSLFIPLQKTTREMGATAMCAGTTACLNADCDKWGMTMYASVDKGGTGALMNSRLFHRGSANAMPPESGVDGTRVMFYMSWAEAPTRPNANRTNARGERKLPPAGGTYAIRTDQMGRTLPQLINRSWSRLSYLDFWSASRGWNFLEVALVKFAADDDEIGEFNLEDIMDGMEHLLMVGLTLLVLHAFMAERELHHYRKNQQEQQQRQHRRQQSKQKEQ